MPIFVNHQAVESFNFSGGECHVKISPSAICEKTDILANLYSSDDIIRLLLTVDAVRRTKPQSHIDLTIPYFPYARQDRVCNEGEALSIKVMADLINALHCESITIVDPHSDVTPALLKNCRTISLAEIIAKSSLKNVIHERKLTLISPDAGAEKKVHAVAKMISSQNNPVDVLCASKTRDTLTGTITGTQIHGSVEGINLIMVDDICDGGRTFIELAKELKNMGSGDVYLYVTHGIFSKGLVVLKEYFKHIYCFQTMLKSEQIDNSFLTLLDTQQIGD